MTHGGHIAVLDWGIGGLPTFARLCAELPLTRLVYRSDAGFPPYGTVPADALGERVREVALDLHRRFGLAALVLACNAASTIAARLSLPFPVLDIISPGISRARRAHAAGARRIGIIGGARTIDARLHELALRAHGIEVHALCAQPLSAHVEAGRLDGPALLADLEPVLAALGEVDALLLACTHYPALSPVIARLRPSLALIDPVDDLVPAVVSLARELPRAAHRAPHCETSGDPAATAASAMAAFAIDVAFAPARSKAG